MSVNANAPRVKMQHTRNGHGKKKLNESNIKYLEDKYGKEGDHNEENDDAEPMLVCW